MRPFRRAHPPTEGSGEPEISDGIIEIAEGGSPSPGAPIATLIDLALGMLTVLVLALTGRGARRSDRWANRRDRLPTWRYLFRLLPLVVFPTLAIWIFGVLPVLEGNRATPLDALLLWPAAMVLLLALAASGMVLLVLRICGRFAPAQKRAVEDHISRA